VTSCVDQGAHRSSARSTGQDTGQDTGQSRQGAGQDTGQGGAGAWGPSRLPPLTRELIDSLATYTWLETTEVGRVAFALAAHPEGGLEAERFARALCLAEPAAGMPYVGERVTVSGSHALLRLDDCPYGVRLAVGPQWSAFGAGGGPIVLIAGLDPLPRCSPPQTVEAYLRHARLRMGTTRAGRDQG
jgi:hypothetical protein